MKATLSNGKVTFTDTDGMYRTRELTAEERVIVESISHGDGQAVAWRYKLASDLQWQYAARKEILYGGYIIEPLYATPSQPSMGGAHAELLAIHDIVLDIAGCPPPTEADTFTVRGVKDMAALINRLVAANQLQEHDAVHPCAEGCEIAEVRGPNKACRDKSQCGYTTPSQDAIEQAIHEVAHSGMAAIKNGKVLTRADMEVSSQDADALLRRCAAHRDVLNAALLDEIDAYLATKGRT